MRYLTGLLALVLVLPVGCARRTSTGGAVVASSYPVWFVASELAGEDLEVVDVTPAGAEPHDLELTPGDVRTIAEAELVLYLGGGFQAAVEEAARDARRAVDLLDAAPAQTSGGVTDPHLWLDPVAMVAVAEQVSAELIEVRPGLESAITQRLEDLVNELTALHHRFEEGLLGCERREFITSHAAFGYLADRYGLEQIAVSGTDPEAEPSPARIAEMIDLAVQTGATTIFYDGSSSSATADAIASEAGMETAPLDPIESRPEGGDYFSAMGSDLQALADALECGS